MKLDGNHLTPVSAGVREKVLISNFKGSIKYKKIDFIADQISNWKI